jgi:hypothetical protein
MSTDFRALCAELAEQLDDALDFTISSCTRAHMRSLTARARAALAQPEPEGVGDEEIEQEAIANADTDDEYRAFKRGAFFVQERISRPTIEPVPVAERLPRPEDCDESGLTCNGGGWCWWFEQSSQMWVADFYSSHYTHWLPAHALPVPTA